MIVDVTFAFKSPSTRLSHVVTSDTLQNWYPLPSQHACFRSSVRGLRDENPPSKTLGLLSILN